jgi:hypothetical protein
MALPFLIPMLIGAGLGAATNPDDKLRGALMGGTLGALTGGLGGAAAGAGSTAMGTGSAATSALGSAQAGLGSVASAEAAKQAAINAASGLVVPTQALGVSAPSLATTLGATESAAAGSGVMAKIAAGIKKDPQTAAQLSNSILGGGQQQQQAPVYASAPIQQGQFGGTPTVEESLAAASGGQPMFAPKGLFDEAKGDLQSEEERRLMLERMQAGIF